MRVIGVGLCLAFAHLIGGGDARQWVVPPPGFVMAVIPNLFLVPYFLFPGYISSLLIGCDFIIPF